ncbi:glycosyltransferase family 8 protein [Streptomyces fulvoviolaceus]|uniref:glycosyltransferase family 8 protein n=1 Tax=Streptomyces fulvoviolaceus TaxID=285535 RepID=UPI0021BED940|nr:glycosyltransferase family 8 protein [Streptomyces fulvoviolaceus]MCT9080449.1 glycosyltransferase family 8 protein [Streptomyces fulvoviolaceus]
MPPIVVGVDDHYLLPLGTMMQSLAVAHLDDLAELRLIVLHEQLSPSGQDTVHRLADSLGLSVELRRLPARASVGFPVSGWISSAVYLRLAVPHTIDVPRALYLDSDVLVLRSLRPLLQHELHGAALAAVRDPQNPVLERGIALPGWSQLGIDGAREYFNSGVMLLDLPNCREQGLFERARRFLHTHREHVRFWDQCALNWAADDQWQRLDRTWNTFALSPLAAQPDFIHHAKPIMPLATLLEDERTASILHFAGPLKPWKANYPGGRLGELYMRHSPAFAAREAR